MRHSNILKGAMLSMAIASTAVALGACAYEPEEISTVSGNTLDRWNRLDKYVPNTLMVNISYEFAYQGPFDVAVPGQYEGVSHMFAEEANSAPERIIQAAVVAPAEGAEPPRGIILVLGQNQYNDTLYCIDRKDDSTIPEGLAPYMAALDRSGLQTSDHLFVRRMVAMKTRDDGKKYEFVYAHDITREGFSCDTLGDPETPTAEAAGYVEQLKLQAERSFEVIG